MNRLTLAAALTAIVFVIPSCSESEAASAVGSYTIDLKPTIDGVIAAQPGGDKIPADQKAEMEKMFAGMFGNMAYTMNADQTFHGSSEATMMGTTKKSTLKGTWTLDKGKVTLNTTHEDGKEKKSTQSGVYADGKLTIDVNQGGQSVKLFLIKKK